MKRYLILLLCLAAACASTPEKRINAHAKEFAAYPQDVQEKIRAGEVAAGFTEEQTAMALGKPDRRYEETTDAGKSEVWAYSERQSKPGVGLGIGMGIGGGGPVGAGVSVGGSTEQVVDRVRVYFSQGRVTRVEELKK